LHARHGTKAKLGTDPTAAEVFAARLKEVREWHPNLSQSRLRDELKKRGHTISRDRIDRLEDGRARPTLEDVLMLALVLDVSPLFLFVPDEHTKLRLGDGPTKTDRETGELREGPESIPAAEARAWIRGEKPLPGQDPAAFAAQRPKDEIPAEYRAAVLAYVPPKLNRYRKETETDAS
jgi:transcriptional regulator with XRE-family HTH domain